jgi:hypothetical protein
VRTLALKIYIDSIKRSILEDQNINLAEQEYLLKSLPKFSSSGVPPWYVQQLKRGRVRKNRILRFDLDKQYLDQLFQNQNGRCALTGELLWFVKTAKNHQYQNASLDRIDSNQGYIKGNVQWVVKEVNMLKTNMTEERFKNICLLVARNIFSDEEIKNLKTKEEMEILKEQEKIRLLHATEEEKLEDFFMFIGRNVDWGLIKADKNQVICFHFPTYFEKWAAEVTDMKKSSRPAYRRELLAAIKTQPWFVSDSARRFRKNEDGAANVKRALTLRADDDFAPEYLKDLYGAIVDEKRRLKPPLDACCLGNVTLQASK